MFFSTKSRKSGETYFLHAKQVTLRGGRPQMIYYFSKECKKEFALKELPKGYEISENRRTGLPLLRKFAQKI